MHRYTIKLNNSLSIWVAQTLSILSTIIISICLLSAVSLLLMNGAIKETGVKYIIMSAHFISSFIGCLFTVNIVNGKFLLHSTVTALGYALFNVFVKMIIGGQWRKDAIFIYATILVAYIISTLITLNRKNKKIKY